MAVLKSLINLLEKEKIKYEILEHRKVYTALDSAETQHVDPKSVAKTLVMKVDNKFALAVIPAVKNLDKSKFKKITKSKKVDFATERWMKGNIKGNIGATPPLGSLFKLPVFMDKTLLKIPKIIINSGDYTKSIRLKSKDLVKLENPVLSLFSKKK